MRAIFAELAHIGPAAADEAVVAMRNDFPEAPARSIIGGFSRRLGHFRKKVG